jgi:hypothetical protein
MHLLFAVLLQAGAVAGPFLPQPKPPATARRCPPSESGEDVVVCARSAEADRLRPIPDYGAGRSLPKAEMTIPGVGALAGEVEQGGVGGFPSNRAMIRLKIPLGGSRRN